MVVPVSIRCLGSTLLGYFDAERRADEARRFAVRRGPISGVRLGVQHVGGAGLTAGALSLRVLSPLAGAFQVHAPRLMGPGFASGCIEGLKQVAMLGLAGVSAVLYGAACLLGVGAGLATLPLALYHESARRSCFLTALQSEDDATVAQAIAANNGLLLAAGRHGFPLSVALRAGHQACVGLIINSLKDRAKLDPEPVHAVFAEGLSTAAPLLQDGAHANLEIYAVMMREGLLMLPLGNYLARHSFATAAIDVCGMRQYVTDVMRPFLPPRNPSSRRLHEICDAHTSKVAVQMVLLQRLARIKPEEATHDKLARESHTLAALRRALAGDRAPETAAVRDFCDRVAVELEREGEPTYDLGHNGWDQLFQDAIGLEPGAAVPRARPRPKAKRVRFDDTAPASAL